MARSLVFATCLVASALVCVAALLLWWEKDHASAVADSRDVATVSAVVALTDDPDHIRSAIARTGAGADGRIAVHLENNRTIGTGRATREEIAGTASGTPAPSSWRVIPGQAVVELTAPKSTVDAQLAGSLTLLAATGVLAAAVAVSLGRRRFTPVLRDVRMLSEAARAGGTRVRAAGPPELVELAAAINEVADRADRLLTTEREVIADVSHRLRTPLTALRLDVDALGNDVVEDRIRSAVSALSHDVDQIIESLRPAAPSSASGCDLAVVVRARMEFWSAYARNGNRLCDVDIPHRPMPIGVSAAVLAAAVDTVLDNIFKHTPEGAPIAVEVVSHAGWITLAVEDGGRGVSAPGEAVLRGRSGGGSTGLGLAIARSAAESAGGSLHVERGRLGGARIRMRFTEAGSTHHDSRPRAWRLWRESYRK